MKKLMKPVGETRRNVLTVLLIVITAIVSVLALAVRFLGGPAGGSLVLLVCGFSAAVSAALLLYLFLANSKKRHEIEQVAFVDRLTGLAKLARMRDIYTRLPDKGAGYAYLTICVDNLTNANQIFGIDSANTLLKGIAQVLAGAVGEGELAIKHHLDQFALLLHAESRAALEERLNSLFAQLADVRARYGDTIYNYPCRCRAGVHLFTGEEASMDEIVNKTEIALSNCPGFPDASYLFFDENMCDDIALQARLLERVGSAFQQMEFQPFFQPKYDLSTGKVIGAETLSRWLLPEGETIKARDFIPLIERKGLSMEFDLYMLEEACKMISKWTLGELMPVPLSVDISMLNVYREDFAEKIIEIIKRYQVPPGLIELELPGPSIQSGDSALFGMMDRLHAFGVVLTVADYGAGMASLELLRNTTISAVKLKVDYFIKRGGQTPRDHVIAESTISMLRAMQIDVVVEWVETKEQADYLREIHCDFAQGFLFAPALPCDQFEALIF